MCDGRPFIYLIHDLTTTIGSSGDALTNTTAKERLSRCRVITRILRHLSTSQTASAVTYNLTRHARPRKSKEGKDRCKIW
jgi:hypothetical protein